MGVAVFHQGENENGQLWASYWDGTNWQQDGQVANVGMSYSPSAVVFGGGIYVFHHGQGQDTQLWYSYFDGTNWQPDTQVPDVVMSFSPSAVAYGGGIYVFYQGYADGPGGSLWYSYFDGANWAQRRGVSILHMSGSPSALVSPVGGISVFHQGIGYNIFGNPLPGTGDGAPWYTYSNNVFNGAADWAQDTKVPDVGMAESPSAIVSPYGGISVFHQGAGASGQLWYTTLGIDGNWVPDTEVPNLVAPPAPIMSQSPSAVAFQGGGISVFYQGLGDDGQLWYSYFDGTHWQPQIQVPDVGMSGSPSAVVV